MGARLFSSAHKVFAAGAGGKSRGSPSSPGWPRAACARCDSLSQAVSRSQRGSAEQAAAAPPPTLLLLVCVNAPCRCRCCCCFSAGAPGALLLTWRHKTNRLASAPVAFGARWSPLETAAADAAADAAEMKIEIDSPPPPLARPHTRRQVDLGAVAKRARPDWRARARLRTKSIYFFACARFLARHQRRRCRRRASSPIVGQPGRIWFGSARRLFCSLARSRAWSYALGRARRR